MTIREFLSGFFERIKFIITMKKHKTLKDRFTYIYKKNAWKSDESVSGPGSTITYTENIRREIPVIIKKYCVKIILDAPCGDYNWFRHVELPLGTKYIGVDIVESIVDNNNKKFGGQNVIFLVRDITIDDMPEADLWFCRDCLFHLNNEEIIKVLKNFKRSNIQLFMSSTHPGCKNNKNILSGDFRLINLEKPPFNLSIPDMYVDDWIEGFPERKMGLWRKESIPDYDVQFR